MSTRVILSLCLAACVAGCASPRPAPPDAASAAESEQEQQASREKLRLLVSIIGEVEAYMKIDEVKSQLNLTREQQAAFCEAYTNQFMQTAADMGALLKSVATFKRVPGAPHRLQSDRELWEPLLTLQQLVTYDEVKAGQRKEKAAELAMQRLKEVESPLGLNEDQKNRVREIFLIYEMQWLKALDDCDFAAAPDMYRWEDRELAEVLTEPQLAQYRELHAPPNSNTQTQLAGAFFVPSTFSLPHFGGSFRAR